MVDANKVAAGASKTSQIGTKLVFGELDRQAKVGTSLLLFRCHDSRFYAESASLALIETIRQATNSQL